MIPPFAGHSHAEGRVIGIVVTGSFKGEPTVNNALIPITALGIVTLTVNR